jgi:hypothetical protein
MHLVLLRWHSATMLGEVVVPEHVAVLVADGVARVRVRPDDLVDLLVPTRAFLEVVVVHKGATLFLVPLLLQRSPPLRALGPQLHAGHNSWVRAVMLGQADPMITTAKRKLSLWSVASVGSVGKCVRCAKCVGG